MVWCRFTSTMLSKNTFVIVNKRKRVRAENDPDRSHATMSLLPCTSPSQMQHMRSSTPSAMSSRPATPIHPLGPVCCSTLQYPSLAMWMAPGDGPPAAPTRLFFELACARVRLQLHVAGGNRYRRESVWMCKDGRTADGERQRCVEIERLNRRHGSRIH